MSRMRRPAPCPRGHAALCPPTLAARSGAPVGAAPPPRIFESSIRPEGRPPTSFPVGAAPPPRIPESSIRPEGGPPTGFSCGSGAPAANLRVKHSARGRASHEFSCGSGAPAANPRIQHSARGRASHGVFLWERRPRRESSNLAFGQRAGLPRGFPVGAAPPPRIFESSIRPEGRPPTSFPVGAAPPPRIPESSIRPEGGPPTGFSCGSGAPAANLRVKHSARGRASHGVFLWERRPRRESSSQAFGPRAGLPRGFPVGAAPPPRIFESSIRPEGGPPTGFSCGSGAPAANPRIQHSARGRASHGVFLWERRPRRESSNLAFGPRAGLPRGFPVGAAPPPRIPESSIRPEGGPPTGFSCGSGAPAANLRVKHSARRRASHGCARPSPVVRRYFQQSASA